MTRGKCPDEKVRLWHNAVADGVRRYVAQKKHCSNLAADAVRAAIEDYWSRRKGAKDEGDQPEG